MPQRSLAQTPRDLPKDTALPGLEAVLDPYVVRELLVSAHSFTDRTPAGVEIRYVRYKPATNCLVAYEVTFADEETSPAWLYGKCYTAPDFAIAVDKLSAKGDRARNDTTPAPVIDRDRQVIVYPIHHDRKLEGLRTVFDARKLTRLIYDALPEYPREAWRISDKRLRPTVIRYKPEKRAVIRLDTKVIERATGEKSRLRLYLRTYENDRGAEIHQLMQQLAAQAPQNGFRVADSLLYVGGKRLLLTREAPGRPLLELLADGSAAEAVEMAGHALAGVHRCTPSAVPDRTNSDVLDDARATAESLCCLLPEMRADIDTLLQTLRGIEALPGTATRFVHGDFYYGQLLVPRDGPPVVLDFDRAYLGDPMADLGNFCAHLHALDLQGRIIDVAELTRAFLRAYSRAMSVKLEEHRLRLWTLFGLFQLSVAPFRSLAPGWREHCKRIVQRCRQLPV